MSYDFRILFYALKLNQESKENILSTPLGIMVSSVQKTARALEAENMKIVPLGPPILEPAIFKPEVRRSSD